jgi:hypothetical protein
LIKEEIKMKDSDLKERYQSLESLNDKDKEGDVPKNGGYVTRYIYERKGSAQADLLKGQRKK